METSLTWLGRLTGSPAEGDWKQLLDVYGPLLAGWLARSGVPAADRDDLVQEVLVVVVRRVSEFDRRGPGAFRAWLRGILANHLKKYFRDRPDSGPRLTWRPSPRPTACSASSGTANTTSTWRRERSSW